MISFAEEIQDEKDKSRSKERYYAKDQMWDNKTIEELKKKYNIFFSSRGVKPIKVVRKNNDNGFLLIIGDEDDGMIWFEKHYGQYENAFDPYWVPFLIDDLLEALNFTLPKGQKIKNPFKEKKK